MAARVGLTRRFIWYSYCIVVQCQFPRVRHYSRAPTTERNVLRTLNMCTKRWKEPPPHWHSVLNEARPRSPLSGARSCMPIRRALYTWTTVLADICGNLSWCFQILIRYSCVSLCPFLYHFAVIIKYTKPYHRKPSSTLPYSNWDCLLIHPYDYRIRRVRGFTSVRGARSIIYAKHGNRTPGVGVGVRASRVGMWAPGSVGARRVPVRTLARQRHGGARAAGRAADRVAAVRRRRRRAHHLAARRLRAGLPRRPAALHVALVGARAWHRFPRLTQECRSPRTAL